LRDKPILGTGGYAANKAGMRSGKHHKGKHLATNNKYSNANYTGSGNAHLTSGSGMHAGSHLGQGYLVDKHIAETSAGTGLTTTGSNLVKDKDFLPTKQDLLLQQ